MHAIAQAHHLLQPHSTQRIATTCAESNVDALSGVLGLCADVCLDSTDQSQYMCWKAIECRYTSTRLVQVHFKPTFGKKDGLQRTNLPFASV